MISSSFDPNSTGAIGSSRGRNAPHQGRRLTRARGTTGTVSNSTQPQWTPRRNFSASRVVRKWKRVRRVPAGTTFSVYLWVPVDQLTEEERALHLPAETNEPSEHSDSVMPGSHNGTDSSNENVDASALEPMDTMIESLFTKPPTGEGTISVPIPMQPMEPSVAYNEANAAPAAPIEPKPTYSEPLEKEEPFPSEPPLHELAPSSDDAPPRSEDVPTPAVQAPEMSLAMTNETVPLRPSVAETSTVDLALEQSAME
jgi:hypothetical protein